MRNRRKFGAEFKARVALAALKEDKTTNQISSEFKVHPNQIVQWKQHLMECAAGIFSNGLKNEKKQNEDLIARLYQEIGQLKVELDWLKKKVGLED